MVLKSETGFLNPLLTESFQRVLIDKLEAFIGAGHGNWTVEAKVIPPNITNFPPDTGLTLKNSGSPDFFFHLMSDESNARPRMWLAGSTGFTSGKEAWEHPGGYTVDYQGISIPLDGEPAPEYFFQIDDDYIYCTIKMDGGWYQHFTFSIPFRYAGVNRGGYVAGSIWFAVRNDDGSDYNSVILSGSGFPNVCHPLGILGDHGEVDREGPGKLFGHDGLWKEVGHKTFSFATDQAYTSLDSIKESNTTRLDHFTPMRIFKTIEQNFITPLHKAYLFSPHTDPVFLNTMAPFGSVEGVFYVDNESIAEDTIFTVGPDKYIIFPACRSRRFVHGGQNFGCAVKTTLP